MDGSFHLTEQIIETDLWKGRLHQEEPHFTQRSDSANRFVELKSTHPGILCSVVSQDCATKTQKKGNKDKSGSHSSINSIIQDCIKTKTFKDQDWVKTKTSACRDQSIRVFIKSMAHKSTAVLVGLDTRPRQDWVYTGGSAPSFKNHVIILFKFDLLSSSSAEFFKLLFKLIAYFNSTHQNPPFNSLWALTVALKGHIVYEQTQVK